ncbi:MAG: DNA primase [Clostridium sp.]|nr:DNA primase [Clostridium sp.]
MPYYPEDVIEEVRARNDIVDIISGYIKLKKSGNSYFGLCPFHGEKTPSFHVMPDRQMYHCFGCGVSGNVYTFVMEYENFTFREAVEMLAERAGVTLPKAEFSREAREASEKKNTLLEINRLAANYYYYQLRNPQGKQGYEYLKRRKLTEETMKRFGLGYANKTSDDLYRYLKEKKGYGDGDLRETGLFTYSERGVHDKFWNRVMFPIMDVNNRVIGFGGRVMGEGEPKYLNSPETRIFEKSRNLYGLNYARTARRGYLLLCEGYMDVIALHQAGFSNAVASLGTSLTERHAALLRRYTDTVILTYDSDDAGVKAALRAIPMLRAVGISVRVLNMRPWKDPDEFIKNLGSEEFEKRIAEARNSFLYEIDVLRKDTDMGDPEQKTRFYNAAARKLLEFTEPLERNNYVEAVAREFYIPQDELKQLVNRLGMKGTAPAQAGEPGPVRQNDRRKKGKDEGIRQSERLLLTWLIEDPSLFALLEGKLGPEDFTEPLYRRAAEDVFEEHRKAVDGKVNAAAILSRYIDDEGTYREAASLFNEDLREPLEGEEHRKAFAETVKRIKKNSLDTRIRNASDIDTLQKLIREQAELRRLFQ